MRLAEVVDIYLPAYRDFGWVRARVWWGSIVTFKLPTEELEDMVDCVEAQPEDRPAIDPKAALRSRRYGSRWPPVAKASTWLVRERARTVTRWRRLDIARGGDDRPWAG